MITTEAYLPIHTIADLIDNGTFVNNKLTGSTTVLDKYDLNIILQPVYAVESINGHKIETIANDIIEPLVERYRKCRHENSLKSRRLGQTRIQLCIANEKTNSADDIRAFIAICAN